MEEIKCGLKRKLHELDQGLPPRDLHKKMMREGLAYYIASEKMPPPNFQKHVLWAMATAPTASEVTLEYVSQRI